MIEFTTGDILRADAEALVNTVNCVGIMGRGIALQFKNAFPANFKAYEAACAREEVQPGKMFVFETRDADQPEVHHQLPDQAALERQEPDGGYRLRPDGAGGRDSRSRHPLHRHPAAWQRPGRAELGGRAPAHRGGAARASTICTSSSSSRTARRWRRSRAMCPNMTPGARRWSC